MKQRLELLMSIVVMACACILARQGAIYVTSQNVEMKKDCVVIDVGHGGFDSGKIGVNGELEKDINLQIALRLKEALACEGVRVVMTREADEGLYDEGSANKKAQDLQRRCEIIEAEKPILTVSIHQNSYPSPEVKGAQVFYYMTSTEGKKLAEILQAHLIEELDPQNHRKVKGNDSYYILKKTSSPIVIVECGFLSNPSEAELLTQEDYQQKVAETIKIGVLDYISGVKNKESKTAKFLYRKMI